MRLFFRFLKNLYDFFTKNELGKYVIVGGSSAIVMLITSFSFFSLGFTPIICTLMGIGLSSTFSFLLQRAWVFKFKGPMIWALVKFCGVVSGTWIFAGFCTYVFVEILSWPFWLLQVSIVVIVALLNFTFNKIWTFSKKVKL